MADTIHFGFRFDPELIAQVDNLANKFERDRTFFIRRLMEHSLSLPIKELGDIINPPVN